MSLRKMILFSAAMLSLATATGVADDKGKAAYDQKCAVCHAAGVAGAPKLGDKAAWEPRLKTGNDALVQSVVKGKGAMPPRAGMNASDAEAKAAVEYMVSKVK